METTTAIDLSGLSERDLERLHRDAAIAADDADGVRGLFDELREAAAAERRRRGSGVTSATTETRLDLDVDPDAIAEDQRDAMTWAVRRRDDERSTEALRSIWAGVVERLADGGRRPAGWRPEAATPTRPREPDLDRAER